MKIFCFGDSLTFGTWGLGSSWVDLLKINVETEYVKKMASDGAPYIEVYNLGVPGDTTIGLSKRIESEFKSRKLPDEENIFIFQIGVNNTLFNNESQELLIDDETSKKSFTEIYKFAKENSKQVIVLNLTPVNEDLVDPIPWEPDFSYLNSEIEKFNSEIIEKIGGQDVIDLNTIFKSSDYKILLEDGIHFNKDGHELVYDLVSSKLNSG